jgi:HlyD family secretion protein
VLEAQKTQHQILSPVGGSALGFNEISVGSFINAGQTVGNISSDDELVAEGMVATKDIGLLRLGQVAKVQVSAFSYTEWGQLAGTVDTITADAIRSAQASQYRVLIRLSGKTLTSADGKEVSVHKGMTGMARIVVARRRLWQMLWETTADWVNPYDAPTGQTARP